MRNPYEQEQELSFPEGILLGLYTIAKGILEPIYTAPTFMRKHFEENKRPNHYLHYPREIPDASTLTARIITGSSIATGINYLAITTITNEHSLVGGLASFVIGTGINILSGLKEAKRNVELVKGDLEQEETLRKAHYNKETKEIYNLPTKEPKRN